MFRNGLEWWRMRSEFQKALSSPKQAKNFVPDADEITNEFVKNIKTTEATKEVPDFLPELARLNLERKILTYYQNSIECTNQNDPRFQ